MRILVTGGFGNIGSHTLPELVRRGHQVRVLSRLNTAARKLAGELRVETVWGDVTNPDVVARAVEGNPKGGVETSGACSGGVGGETALSQDQVGRGIAAAWGARSNKRSVVFEHPVV